jgi:hypothetical protein
VLARPGITAHSKRTANFRVLISGLPTRGSLFQACFTRGSLATYAGICATDGALVPITTTGTLVENERGIVLYMPAPNEFGSDYATFTCAQLSPTSPHLYPSSLAPCLIDGICCLQSVPCTPLGAHRPSPPTTTDRLVDREDATLVSPDGVINISVRTHGQHSARTLRCIRALFSLTTLHFVCCQVRALNDAPVARRRTARLTNASEPVTFTLDGVDVDENSSLPLTYAPSFAPHTFARIVDFPVGGRLFQVNASGGTGQLLDATITAVSSPPPSTNTYLLLTLPTSQPSTTYT